MGRAFGFSPLLQEKLMTVEKLDISDIKEHDGYASTIKSGNTVWNARSTQIITKDDDYDTTNNERINNLEKKINAMQDSLDKILDKLIGA